MPQIVCFPHTADPCSAVIGDRALLSAAHSEDWLMLLGHQNYYMVAVGGMGDLVTSVLPGFAPTPSPSIFSGRIIPFKLQSYLRPMLSPRRPGLSNYSSSGPHVTLPCHKSLCRDLCAGDGCVCTHDADERYEVTEGVFRRRRLRGDVTRKEWRQTGVFVAQHHLRVELTLMRTLHLTNILLPLSLITALCLSPSQRGTQSCSKKSETQEPRTDLLIPRAETEDTCPRCRCTICSMTPS
ncbi:hypothetical protein F7725_028619 [Dissostichus mawsoni]|uniref:Uncharacterized protein n=1 Tax=Dissostichus mawsoni TaxID=36200 RepID=A0A7J5XGI7_DISMA|nr:hypothetical protein F7725_028619 [Dissostichus mawsoni]